MLVNIKEIKKLVEEETERGIKNWGHHHSRHEGYAVAKEELDEMETEYDVIAYDMHQLWEKVKANTEQMEMVESLEKIKTETIYMLAEGIQFAAMLEKMIRFENK